MRLEITMENYFSRGNFFNDFLGIRGGRHPRKSCSVGGQLPTKLSVDLGLD